MIPAPRPQSPSEEPIQQLLLMIVQTLVDETESVRVDSRQEDGITVLNVHVAPDDTGKIIGKQGRTARSLRTILGAAGMKLHRRYALNIEDENHPM